MKDIAVIVLAAGLGTRMKSKAVKVLHPLAGRPMVLHTIENVMGIGPERVVAVLGHQAKEVAKVLPEGIATAHQKEQLGTAHAAMTGLKKLTGFSGTVMVVAGDTPLLATETFRQLLKRHKKARADVSVLTTRLADPTGYGRVVRDKAGISRIVEHKDATGVERAIDEVNAGTYCFEAGALKAALKRVKSENVQKEFYLTDVVEITRARGGKVLGVESDRPDEALGINSRADLSRAEKTMRGWINRRLMDAGVMMTDPETTYIGADVVIGRDTVIHPGNHITGRTVIGEGCTLMPGNIISDTMLKDGVSVKGYSVLDGSVVEPGAAIGPFAHLRPGSHIGRKAKVGNFVELKKTTLGEGAKASHLSYLGDAEIGRDVNVGAGTITCNYDGYGKFKTIIEDGVFVGSDTQFVAPVRVGKDSIIAAGSTVTGDVPEDSLAISRTPQTNKTGWAGRWRKAKEKAKK